MYMIINRNLVQITRSPRIWSDVSSRRCYPSERALVGGICNAQFILEVKTVLHNTALCWGNYAVIGFQASTVSLLCIRHKHGAKGWKGKDITDTLKL